MVEGRVMVTAEVPQLWNSLTDPTFRFLIMIFIFHMITMTATSSCSSPSIWSWLKKLWNSLLSSSRHHHYQPYQQYQNTWILFSGWDSLFWGTGWLREGLSQRTGHQCWYFTWYHHDPLMIHWWSIDDMMRIWRMWLMESKLIGFKKKNKFSFVKLFLFLILQVLVHKYIDWIQAITGIAFGAVFGW